MSDGTHIEWCNASWPVVAGCDKISSGCTNCWAIKDSWRLAHNPNPAIASIYDGTAHKTAGGALNWTRLVRPLPQRLDWPLRWRKPRKVFVCSQSDLFHEDVPDEFIDRVFAVMALSAQHTFQVLSKRAGRMQAYMRGVGLRRRWADAVLSVADAAGLRLRRFDSGMSPAGVAEAIRGGLRGPFPNVWVGESAENQQSADERIPLLLDTPAAVRWVSAEPLLAPIDLGAWLYRHTKWQRRLDWVVVGGESGPGARVCHVEWVRSIVEQCRSAGVPAFIKQLGARPLTHSLRRRRDTPGGWADHVVFEATDDVAQPCRAVLYDRKGGDLDEWPADLRVREYPEASGSPHDGAPCVSPARRRARANAE